MNAKRPKSLSDEQLVNQLQQGDKNAMGELYSRYYTRVYNKCLSFAKNPDDASDMAQEVMLRVMNKICTFKGEAKFSTWLYAITFNFCIDFSQKRKMRFYELLENSINLSVYAEHSYQEVVEKEIIPEIANQALSAISEEDLNLLLMKYQFDKSIVEIQAIYKLSASAVKMRLMRARAKATYCYESMVPGYAA